jgi:hypothetical protein
MPSSYLFFKDRKTSNRLVWFILTAVLISVLLLLCFGKKDRPPTDKYNQPIEVDTPGSLSS